MNLITKLIFCFLFSLKAFALVPVESLILGNMSAEYDEKQSDPLSFIFQGPLQRTTKDKDLNKLALFRGFIIEGENLVNFCKERNPKINYIEPWQKTQTIRSVMATAQFIGIDLTVRAISAYAKYFEFSFDDYETLVDNLTGNYCSENISIISKKQLNKFMKLKYERNNYKLPDVSENSLFPERLSKFIPEAEARKKEFKFTLDLFKSFCSWGNQVSDIKGLAHIFRNPVFMALVSREMAGRVLEWDREENNFYLREDGKTTRVLCSNLICRKRSNEDFDIEVFRAIGSFSIKDDVDRLYCDYFRDLDFNYRHPDPKIKGLIDSWSFDDMNMLNSHLISLATGIPDFLLRSENFNDAKIYMRASFDRMWDNWAKGQNENYNKYLFYEESLTIEKVTQEIYFNRYLKKFSVEFDVNLGEMDRVNQKIGKIQVLFNLKLSEKLINSLTKEWSVLDPTMKQERAFILKRFEDTIRRDVEKASEKFAIKIWNKGLEKLIVRELLDQFVTYDGPLYDLRSTKLVTIPIKLNFSQSALEYIRYKYLIDKNQKRKLFDISKINKKDGKLSKSK